MESAKDKKQTSKLVGTVTADERDGIKALHERKNGLVEFIKSLSDIDKDETNKLYDKLVRDMADTSAKYQEWFDTMSKKYKWENIPGCRWEINFETCEVFLKK